MTPSSQKIGPPGFPGRFTKLLYRLQDAVNTDGLHVILFGDRGIGKTSLARVVATISQEPKQEAGRRSVLVVCNSSDTFASIWRKISQEMLVREITPTMGFETARQNTPTLRRLDIDSEAIGDPNDVRLFVNSLPNPQLIVIDEFDRVAPDSDASRLMADTMKLFSETGASATLMVVGVAESVGGLIAGHQSITRNTAQVQVEPMPVEELREIVDKGFTRVGLTFDTNLDWAIARMSQGYPSYTHLLALWCGRGAVEASRTHVTRSDLNQAIPRALENATGGMQQEYERAIASSQPNTLYKEVLTACAIVTKDSLGRFSASDIRQPLRGITGRDYGTGAFQSHLAKFCEPLRGILKRTGSRRNYKWQFLNPQLIPYVRLRGVRDGIIQEQD